MTAEQRRRVIVETAVRLFAEKGFRGTTTRELASAAGVTEPVLYQHFATKSELYSAILEALIERDTVDHTDTFAAACAAEDDTTYFTLLGEIILEWHIRRPEVLRLLLFSALEGHGMAEQFHDRHVRVVYECVASRIRGRIAAGGFRDMDAYLAARAFVGMIGHQGMAMTIYGLRDLRGSRKQIVANLVSIFLNGMKTERLKAS